MLEDKQNHGMVLCACGTGNRGAIGEIWNRLRKDFEAAYHLLYLTSSTIAWKLKPVRTLCEDNDIKLAVISVYVERSEAKILILVQDGALLFHWRV